MSVMLSRFRLLVTFEEEKQSLINFLLQLESRNVYMECTRPKRGRQFGSEVLRTIKQLIAARN
jgi:hypothetical protein